MDLHTHVSCMFYVSQDILQVWLGVLLSLVVVRVPVRWHISVGRGSSWLVVVLAPVVEVVAVAHITHLFLTSTYPR